MRTYEQVGRLTKSESELNKAYLTYASLFLDFENDSLLSFSYHDDDIAPLVKRGLYDKDDCDDEKAKAYMDDAVELAIIIMQNGYFNSFEELYTTYPPLKDRSDDIESKFYEDNEHGKRYNAQSKS